MQAWSATDIGKKRKENQDNTFVKISYENNYTLCMVCDGMGGMNAGAEASRIASEAFSEAIVSAVDSKAPSDVQVKLIKNAIKTANSAVFDKAYSDPSCNGMGTTLTAALIINKKAYVVNIGDSRTYAIDSDIHQITDDHSIAGDLFRKGKISREEFDKFPDKNIITRAIGTDPHVAGDIFIIDLKDDEILLLCSDGLTNMLPDKEIYDTVKGAESLKEACELLIKKANKAGGRDNISTVIFKLS